jgi:hypothetical protein
VLWVFVAALYRDEQRAEIEKRMGMGLKNFGYLVSAERPVCQLALSRNLAIHLTELVEKLHCD